MEFLVGWILLGGLVGAAIGSNKGRSGAGFVLGALVGPIGWLLIAFGPDETPGTLCPACKGKVPDGAVKCMHCGSDVPQQAKQ